MPQLQDNTIIISLGGSLVVPEQIDVGFLKRFKKVIQKYLKTKKFVIFVGGGKTARAYQKALSDFKADSAQRDWVGIFSSRLNAEVLKNVFGKDSYNKVVVDPNQKAPGNKKIVIGAGYKPGNSTDYVAVLAAKTYGVKTIINLTNIDYVYNKNPKKFPGAMPFEEIAWKDFQKIVGVKWIPGMNAPFDPKASKLAAKHKMKVVIINGQKLQELENFLNQKPFAGTTIK